MRDYVGVGMTFASISELGMLSGVAAILRFPMPDLEAEELDDDSSDSDGWLILMNILIKSTNFFHSNLFFTVFM